MTNPWINDDGLEQRYGNEQSAVALGGKDSTKGEFQELVFKITGTDVPTADAPIFKHVGLPQGADIVSAVLYCDVAFTSSGAATLDIGLWSDDGDGTYTVNDDNGLIAALAKASITAGSQNVGAGALIGAKVPTVAGGRDLVVSWGYNTAAFDLGGSADLVVTYRK